MEAKKPVVTQRHEQHQEESETRQEGGDESTSWSRVLKVTKKTERTSKTEQCTKTYKVVGSGDDQRLVECSETSDQKSVETPASPVTKEDEKQQLKEPTTATTELVANVDDDNKSDGKAEKEAGEKKRKGLCSCCSKKCVIS